MLSRLREIVSSVAEENELKMENYEMDKIAIIERRLNANGDIETAMSDLDKIFGFHWDKYYEQIKKFLEGRK